MLLLRKILLINTGLLGAATLGAAFATDTFPGNGFFLMLGFITFVAAAGSLILGLLLLPVKDRRYAQAFLLTAAIFGVLGVVSFFLLNRY